MFYRYRQNNSGGSFHFNEQQGISVEVVIEARDKDEAMRRAEHIGLYFDGCSTGRDCSCCGDRWSDWADESVDPPVAPGEMFPAKDEESSLWSKWMDEGIPEGFIHFADGRVEGYHATTKQRQDLTGEYGWGVVYNRYGADQFLCGKNGWDEAGNHCAPWAQYEGTGVLPDVDQVIKTDRQHGYGKAWFRNEADAAEFVADYNRAILGLNQIIREIKSITKDGEKVPSNVLKTAKAVFLK